nr:hypothetical protein [Mesorhizobium silamurunense]
MQPAFPIVDLDGTETCFGAASTHFISHLKYCHKLLLFNHKMRRRAARLGTGQGSGHAQCLFNGWALAMAVLWGTDMSISATIEGHSGRIYRGIQALLVASIAATATAVFGLTENASRATALTMAATSTSLALLVLM